jgi:hypothetical protein
MAGSLKILLLPEREINPSGHKSHKERVKYGREA